MPRLEIQSEFNGEECQGCAVRSQCKAGQLVTTITTAVGNEGTAHFYRAEVPITDAMVDDESDGMATMVDLANELSSRLIKGREHYTKVARGLNALFEGVAKAQNLDDGVLDERGSELGKLRDEFGALAAPTPYPYFGTGDLQTAAEDMIKYNGTGDCLAIKLQVNE